MSLTPRPASPLFNCLIRTHHITSRKKLQHVRRAAEQLRVDWVLVRSGACPGVMFAEARDEEALRSWVSAVQALRYKDFRCVARPSLSDRTVVIPPAEVEGCGGFEETSSMKTFADKLEARGLGEWYRKLMFTGVSVWRGVSGR